MEKFINDLDPTAVWKAVRAMIASALTFLRGNFPERYLYGAQKMLRQVENKVREQLALMAFQMEIAPHAPRTDMPRKKSKPKPRIRKRSFAVLPFGLSDYEYSYTPEMPFDTPTPIETHLAAFDARVEVLEAVMVAPERHARRLARMMRARDAIGVSFRFLGAGIRLPMEQVRKFLSPEYAPAINDSG